MAKAKKGLGMGLDALLKMNVQDETVPLDDNTEQKEIIAGFVEISIDKIIPNQDQPRKYFNEESIEELAQSIKSLGLLQPISVLRKDDKYEIIAGERRYRACKLIGLEKVPVIIKDITQKEKLELSLVENIQRENLNAIEEALAYSSLIETYNITQEELSKSIGKSRTAITNSIRLLNLDAQIRKWIMEGKITPGHARAILSIATKKQHLSFASHIIEKQLNVRETESLSKKWPPEIKKTESKKEPVKSIELKNAEEKLQQKLQTKVAISGSENKGKIHIDYFSMEELERIIEILGAKL